MKNQKLNLFGFEELTSDWQKEWKDMPEFIQDKKDCYCKIIVRFNNEEDLQEFSKLIGQKLTNKTKSIWHPFKSHFSNIKKYWADES
jgi:hypothetical protein